MKKWIIFLIVLLIIALWTSIETYQSAHTYRNQLAENAITIATEQEPNLEVTDLSFYNGTKSYTIVYGRVNHQSQVFCVPTDGKGEVIVIDPTKGITANEAAMILKDDRNPLEIKTVNLGIEQNVPIWEIIYIDQQNRYSYYYVTFENGEFIKRYTL